MFMQGRVKALPLGVHFTAPFNAQCLQLLALLMHHVKDLFLLLMHCGEHLVMQLVHLHAQFVHILMGRGTGMDHSQFHLHIGEARFQ